MALFVPAAIGSVLFLAFLFGSKKGPSDAAIKKEVEAMTPEQQAALKATAAAAEAKDWLLAIASAVKTQSPTVLRELAAKMQAAGMKEGAADLLELAAKLEKPPTPAGQAPPTLAKPPTTATKPKPKPTTKPPTTKPPTTAPVLPKPTPTPTPKPTADGAKRQQAGTLKSHLATAVRYKEDRTKVAAYQKANSLLNDGMYGPGTARSFWTIYKIVPVNPYYWSKSTASKDMAAYQAFLDTIKADSPSKAAEVDKLKKTVGK